MGKTAVYFSTREFESSHGRAPRGFGSWAFCDDHKARNPLNDDIFWVHQSTFSAAKKAARAHFAQAAQGLPVAFVAVLP